MKVKVYTNCDIEETLVEIHCKSETTEVKKLVNYINNSYINLTGKKDGETFILNLDDIYYFEAVENRVFAYLESDVYEVQYKIADLNELLVTTSFIQTSRTIILNIDKIVKIKTLVNGRIEADLINKEKMIISRAYGNNFKTKLKGGNQ